MNYHQNARLTVQSRAELVRRVLQGTTLKEAAAQFGVSANTAAKWVRRFHQEGPAGLGDRSSRPHRLRAPTSPEKLRLVETLRHERWTGWRIALQTELSRATVSRILRRLKLSRMRDLNPPAPVQRYEHDAPGDLLHLDIKKLGRIVRPSHRVTGDRRDSVSGTGWEHVHVAIDDHTRIAFSAVLPDERQASVLIFLRDAVAYYARLGIHFRAVLTDNGPAYRSQAFAAECRRLGLKHRFTRPYTPRTNGKAERFIQTALREWAHARTYQNSAERTRSLSVWLHQYNWHRPHASLGLSPPISRSGLDRNNLLRLHN
ncbi:MAG: IS481 family transposase [Acidobacteriia bacterium]|nr:IS481 family transposase [Terriglobia bacterium]